MGVVIGISVPLRIAAGATAASVVLGVGLAWLLVNRRFPGRRELGWLLTGALALPSPVIVYALVWRDTRPVALTVAGMVSAIPWLVREGRTAFAGLDPIYGNAARGLGASDWRVFWKVELPLVFRSALAAAGLIFVRVFLESAAALLKLNAFTS